jgi:hypothetical protein
MTLYFIFANSGLSFANFGLSKRLSVTSNHLILRAKKVVCVKIAGLLPCIGDDNRLELPK